MDVITINTRGLNESSKRQTLFHWLKSNKYKIVCLQETFLTSDKLNSFNTDWNAPCFHCVSNSNHSRGVSILINDNFEHEILGVHSSNDGRKLLLNLKHKGQTYCIVNIYAPTDITQRKNFFCELRKWISDKTVNSNAVILCGDFNSTLADIDRKQFSIDRTRPVFKDLIKYLNIDDVFRHLNKNKICFTYSNASKTVHSNIPLYY